MSMLWYALINAIETLLRMVPWPCKTGLIEIGHPDRHSPVLLTCNYSLTVERVRRALRGVDGYLLVANSRGVNVWCSAAGGLFTHHDVISALKTSGIEGRVEHRTVILPQLVAIGVEAREVQQRAGWEVLWGPVEARDLPAFLASEGRKTPGMRAVSFGWGRRLEMAVAWAFPLSLFVALMLLILWRAALLPAVLLTWALALVVFGAFPLYARWLGPRTPGGRRLPFEQGGLQIALWGLCLLGLVVYASLAGTLVWVWLWRWGLLSLVLVVLVAVDLTGMTPVYKSGTHEDRRFRIALDVERCVGDGACERVCPRNCFVLDVERGKATMPHALRCVQCGACIVQCPGDALSFVGPAGEVLAPETIRRYKLNMMGKRAQHSR
jgi:NAD-dependent dihydropyrimidine dehydrogenase PreA subunit